MLFAGRKNRLDQIKAPHTYRGALGFMLESYKPKLKAAARLRWDDLFPFGL